MFKRLRLRLTLVCTLSTILVLTGMALASLRFAEGQFLLQAEKSFDSSLNGILYYLRGQTTIDYGWLAQTESSGGMLIRLEDKGRPLRYLENDPMRDRLTLAAQQVAAEQYGFSAQRPPSGTLQADVTQFRAELEGREYRAAVCAVPTQGGWLGVTVLRSTRWEDHQIFVLRVTFGACVFAASLLLGLFAWLFTGSAVRPVMESRQQQAEFVSAASHELRSPLAVMQASAGAMQDAPPEKARQFARTIEGECVRLSGLAADLLTLAGADSSRWSLELRQTEPETLLLTAAERFEALAGQKQIQILARLPDNPLPRLRCDPGRVEQLLGILLDNAVEYTPAGGAIRLDVAERGRRWLEFSVEDTGPGIADAHKEKVFRRFYRGDAARTARQHYGLGLSVAQEIARLHRGTIRVEDAPAGGARFLVRLPVI